MWYNCIVDNICINTIFIGIVARNICISDVIRLLQVIKRPGQYNPLDLSILSICCLSHYRKYVNMIGHNTAHAKARANEREYMYVCMYAYH